ncbi:DUF3326 domain-containing protein [Alienimonas sp. DA493]|uniref:DUF3326 domain-containing protein n=1 Tax=Alienimonas sp. DA493 TaxID=3373605 RepID=UPI0037549B86
MHVKSVSLNVNAQTVLGDLAHLRRELEERCGGIPLRFSAIESRGETVRCEVETAFGFEGAEFPSIFQWRRRGPERVDALNAVMLVPTGVDCTIGGHAGDATPAAKVLAEVCDRLVLHPNVVNASDVNEQPENALYVEGSQICRLLTGAAGLRRVRSNRVLVVTDPAEPEGAGFEEDGELGSGWVLDQVVNCASTARATMGIEVPEVLIAHGGLGVRIEYSPAGRATGRIDSLEPLVRLLRGRRAEFDAVAVASKITPPVDSLALHADYFNGDRPNPWGGAEAALTHTLSSLLEVPVAHAPTMSDLSLRTERYGRVDPRKAAEVISVTYLMCVLKGLHKAPALVPGSANYDPSELHAEDVSALVVPDGCLGLPVLAARAQGIRVIAVQENENLMRNDLADLGWAPGQFYRVSSYLEAAGLLAAIKAGVSPESVRRPIAATRVRHGGAPKVTPFPASAPDVSLRRADARNGHWVGVN